MRNNFRRLWPILIVFALLSVIGYIVASATYYGVGFPLDDAWIHQTYARSLWQDQAWTFVPGVPSAGSTAPLWSVMLALGHGFGQGTYWAYFLGFALFAILAALSALWLEVRQPKYSRYAWLAGFLILIEWHLVWAAVSGMEIILAALVAVGVLFWLDGGFKRPILLGLLIGMGVWVRPDMILLLLPLGWHWFWLIKPDWTKLLNRYLAVGIGVALSVVPYGLFNLMIGGTLLPNTFFAKQAEYAILVQQDLFTRFFDQFLVPLVGIGIVLLPGVIYSIYDVIKERRINRLAPIIWVIMMMALYAIRLPVTYQHGRYLMPTVPIWTILGCEGLLLWVQPRSEALWKRVVSRAWVLVLIIVGSAFWILGARAYARDVAIIETEMVATSKWIAENTPEGSLIAAHDIGALGYFGKRQILDLAGLISPEVIPFIRDEAQLGNFLDSNEADYLMSFPGWYTNLVVGKLEVFSSGAIYSPAAGGENMAVYWLD